MTHPWCHVYSPETIDIKSQFFIPNLATDVSPTQPPTQTHNFSVIPWHVMSVSLCMYSPHISSSPPDPLVWWTRLHCTVWPHPHMNQTVPDTRTIHSSLKLVLTHKSGFHINLNTGKEGIFPNQLFTKTSMAIKLCIFALCPELYPANLL